MNIKELMSEIDDELKGTFNTQETLEPNFWPLGKKLRPSIRKRLIEIAQDFYDSLEIDADLTDAEFAKSARDARPKSGLRESKKRRRIRIKIK